MENLRAYAALIQVAQNNGTSLETVIAEIESFIAEAIANAEKTRNQAVLDKWKAIPCAGECPTATELIAYISSQIDLGC